MVSPMASTCNHYATKCTKTRTKILQPKNNEKEKNAPGKGQKGRNRVRFGCWRGWQRLEADESGWERRSEQGRGGRLLLSLAKWRDGLVSPAGSVSSRQSATGARSPLGTRFWSGCGKTQRVAGEGRCHPDSAASLKEAGAGLVLRALFGEGLCIDYHFFLRKKSTSARRMAKLTRITAG